MFYYFSVVLLVVQHAFPSGIKFRYLKSPLRVIVISGFKTTKRLGDFLALFNSKLLSIGLIHALRITEEAKLFLKVKTKLLIQVLGWLHAIEAYQKSGIDIPVNLKFCLEGMEESGSDGLDELLVKHILSVLSSLG